MVQGTPKLLGRRKTVGLPAEAPAARFDADVTLAAVAREWLLDLRVMGRSPRTIGFYDQKLKQFLRESAATRLADLTAFELKRYIGELRERELSDHTIHGAYEVLKALGNWANREGYPVDPALLLVRAPKVANKEMETLTHPQVDALLEAAPQSWPRLAVQILLGTGMRHCCDSGDVNTVGEPCEGEPHARFDEGRLARLQGRTSRLLSCPGPPPHTQLEHLQVHMSAPGLAICRGPWVPEEVALEAFAKSSTISERQQAAWHNRT